MMGLQVVHDHHVAGLQPAQLHQIKEIGYERYLTLQVGGQHE